MNLCCKYTAKKLFKDLEEISLINKIGLEKLKKYDKLKLKYTVAENIEDESNFI